MSELKSNNSKEPGQSAGANKAPQPARANVGTVVNGKIILPSQKPIDFSDLLSTQAQIKKMFRDNEVRGTWFHR